MAVRMSSADGRWIIAATVLGSGIAFLDGTVVNVALRAIAEDFDTNTHALQWTIDAYLVTLTALLLLGGSVGDLFGRKRVYIGGLVAFTAASVVCAVAPSSVWLSAARAAQGVGGAFLVPGSLAIIAASFDEDRSRAIGAWSGLTGVASAIGPFLGGWLVDAVSWRLVFLINVPLAAACVWVTVRHVPESRSHVTARPDWVGAALASLGLAALCWGLIEQSLPVGLVGAALFVAFLVVESRLPAPMLPLGLFKRRQFTGANLTTLAVYSALGGAFFFLVLELQIALGYSALEAGSALLPVTVLMLLLSSRAGALAQRIGPRIPMTVGPIVVGLGMLLFTRIEPGMSYWRAVFPGAIVFGLGLACTVAPLTATVLAAVDADDLGIGSGVNNAVARLAGLLAVAVLPSLVAFDTDASAQAVSDAVSDAMMISAVVAVAGGVIAFLTVRTSALVDEPAAMPNVVHPCGDPCRVKLSA
ncbi:MAG TPA: MFS transporter [Acidimicrobiia bacterium]|nr:MFS transporter [Acidimicrobiia bacterium]